jgi:hypothetical protein
MQEITNDYNELLQILQERWRGHADWFSEQLEISPSKASRILAGKQQAPVQLLSDMAAIVGIDVRLVVTELR